MNEKIKKLLDGKGGNYLLPFFWQHGEDEATLRHYMKIIHESGIWAVCVESRPHPDFCGPLWWRDMDIILDEARTRDMKVWILDDSHFPTGYANGALKSAPQEMRRQFITYQIVEEVDESIKPLPFKRSIIESEILAHELRDELETFDDDKLLGFIAIKKDGKSAEDIIEINKNTPMPEGDWKIYCLHLTRNRGPHRDYINMLNQDACKLLIDAVYKPHHDRYKADFGTTIAGFFSDEPEFGNGHLYDMWLTLEDVDDQPWSHEVETELKSRWGNNWHKYLPLLWDKDFDHHFKAQIRYDYMDTITRNVEHNFSWQIGDWCRAHGVEYIGHIIEDNNQHTRTGCSLGHFFRSMSGQDMAGIDNIGGQVLPQGEDLEIVSGLGHKRDGEFFHYALAKLASSAASIDPLKKGRAMCEIFGNYGWEAGVRIFKYLAEHFMVRGVNHFVPHAFSPKAFPDPDAPPHFYAHGHNPQYRHFGQLMRYMNRVCELINGGKRVTPAAILYHAEADWAGGKYMYSQVPARILADNQIDYDIIPADVFFDEKYDGVLSKYKALIVPETSFMTKELKAKLDTSPIPIIYDLDFTGLAEISITPANNRIRYMHYKNSSDLYYFVNESAVTYHGTVNLPTTGDSYIYNAWDNVLEAWDGKNITLESSKGLIIVFDTPDRPLSKPIKASGTPMPLNSGWIRSICKSIEYPTFKEEKNIDLPDNIEYAGFIRYEKIIKAPSSKKTILEISDAYEGIEVFINGISAGIQIVPTFLYDITSLLREGDNHIIIEVATTLERQLCPTPTNPCGITGNVILWIN
ncbi:MAG: hypothetical protein FWE11_03165 [Defluviitaleaceae bacterium]|nr:hypothetical protein [Defluviitaleaceae bacterium]